MLQKQPHSGREAWNRRALCLFAVTDRRKLGRIALFMLLFATFVLDFAHGIALGQDRILFGPIYRLRQSLAIATSRLHDPPARGYVAYGSVVDVFNQNGFAIFPEEAGEHLDIRGWIDLYENGAKLNRILNAAVHVPIDQKIKPEIIRGNELAYVDYIYIAFKLFGVEVSSLYYLYYLILGASCLLYASEFRREPFLIYLLTIYLASQFFLQNYMHSKGFELNTAFNSRLLPALSLLPAAHVMLVLWRTRRPSAQTMLSVCIQSALLAFIVSCRFEAMWQVLMILAAATCLGLSPLLTRTVMDRREAFARRWTRLWPAAAVALLLVANTVQIDLAADRLYKTEPKTHIFWHEVLMGILSASDTLQRKYLGHVEDPYSDTMVYEAVINDLRTRGDRSAPGAVTTGDGQITIDLWSGWGNYDRLARSLTLRIIARHPILVASGLVQKVKDQIDNYSARKALAATNFYVFFLIAIAAAGACASAGGMVVNRRRFRQGVAITAFFLAFSWLTPAIEPSALAVSTLLCYLTAIAIGCSYGAAAIGQRLHANGASPASLPPIDR